MSDAALWTVADLVAATGGRLLGDAPQAVSGLSIDSRSMTPGEAFFAIRGDRFDGHDFVGAARAAGAGLSVIAEARADAYPPNAWPLLLVDDPLRALERLAAAARARAKARIVAVTGSVGKTGTKEALRLVLSTQGMTHASPASFNNHWGVPLSLARLPRDADYAIFEIGMNHAGEITPLTRLVRPHVAVVTTVAAVHLEHFGSVEAIAEAKAEIFLGLDDAGVAIINRDIDTFDLLRRRAEEAGSRIITFGEHEDADARLIRVKLHPQCSCVQASIEGEEITYKLGAPGKHIVVNSLAVMAAARALGADIALAGLELARLQPPKGRGARVKLGTPKGTLTLIDESYNANPASMRAAIALLGQAEPEGRGRRIAVLGDMLELGRDGGALHADLARPLAEAHVDRVFAAGTLMKSLWEALPVDRRGGYAETSAALESALFADVGAGDVVMIKGSFGSRMGPLVEALANRYRPVPAEDGDGD